MSTILALRAHVRRLSLQITRGRVQIAAGLLAAFFAYQGFNQFEPFKGAAGFDKTAQWLGLALLCLVVVAWDGAQPHPTTWPARLAAFLGRRWWELALLLAIVGFSVFMFTFRFGEFPPSNLICCEENLKGQGGFDIIRGDRPLEYSLGRYSIALGFLLVGENTLGLRLLPLLAGIFMVPVFYLLLRQLVGPPAALFATVLLASLWPLTLTGGTPQVHYLATVLFVYLLILGIRTRNALALLGAGFLAGVLSYEYAPYKAVPLVAGGFLTALVAYRLAIPLPNGARAFLARLGSLVRTNLRSTVVFVGAALIASIPLLVTVDEGNSLYFKRFDDQISSRDVSGTPGFLATNWEEQLGWAAELFVPFGSDTFRFGFTPNAPLVDPITGTLLVLGVILAVITFWRPFRLLFLAWYVGVLGAGALLLADFNAFKFINVLPAGIVLVAFVVDDLGGVVGRWARGSAVYLLPLLLLGSAVYVAYWNADTLFGTAVKEPGILQEYEGRGGQQYALCDYLQGRGSENFSYTYNPFDPTLGFARPHKTAVEQAKAWSSFLWVCHDLRGQALASSAEVWPLRDIPAGPLTWAFVIDSARNDELVESLGRAIPSKTEPDRIITGAAGIRKVVAYELSGEELKANQGLFGEYRSGEEGTLLAERVDDVRSVLWDAQSGISPPFTVQWRGLIYVPQASTAALTARTSDPTLITVDGQVSYSSQGEEPASFPRDLLPGWHPVEILLRKVTPGGSFALQWVGPVGLTSSIARQDLFALSSLAGWIHERTTVSIPFVPARTQRLDFAPHVSSLGVIKLEFQREERLATVVDERWSAVWRVREGREYKLNLVVLSGAASVKLDGATVLRVDGNARAAEAVVLISAGDHRLEIRQRHDGGAWLGVRFDILASDDTVFAPEFSPY